MGILRRLFSMFSGSGRRTSTSGTTASAGVGGSRSTGGTGGLVAKLRRLVR